MEDLQNKTCQRCLKTFKSVYLLNKHLNRKTPCNIIKKEKNYTLYKSPKKRNKFTILL